MPSPKQDAMKTILSYVESDTMKPYVRSSLPAPDTALLMQATQDPNVWNTTNVKDQTLVNLALDLFNDGSRVSVSDLLRELDRDALFGVWKALGTLVDFTVTDNIVAEDGEAASDLVDGPEDNADVSSAAT